MIELVDCAGGVLLAVVARPGARRAGVLGERSGALMVAVAAPPDKGKANLALEKALATALGLRPSQISLESGRTSRRKRFLIQGVAKHELAARLANLVSIQTPNDPEPAHDQSA